MKSIVNQIKWLSIILSFIFTLWTTHANGQEKHILISKDYNNLRLERALQLIEQDYQVNFYFPPHKLPDIILDISQDSLDLTDVLKTHLEPYDFYVSHDNKGNFFILNKRIDTRLSDDFFSTMVFRKESIKKSLDAESKKQGENYVKTYNDYITKTITVSNKEGVVRNHNPQISGFVTNKEDNEPIVNATLKIEELEKYITTDVSGYYSMNIPKGEYTLVVNSMGSHEKKYKVIIRSDGKLNIALDTKTYLVGEAVVTANRHHNVKGTQMGFEKLSPKAIKKLPVVLGEKDIGKIALLLPGVQTISEASSGFNVRGSPADQNIFYINNLPVYNATHLYGMFSAFNSDAIKEFSLYKSNIPISYGGRLSSIFDAQTKAGNMKNYSARGGISPVTGRILVEGPIQKEKSSFLVGFRTTYSDWILNQIKDVSIRNSQASFRDLMGNLSFKLNSRNDLNIFAYGSEDFSDLEIGMKNNYSNAGGSLQWEHRFSKRLSSTLDIVHSSYSFAEENDEFDYSASRQTFSLTHSELKWNMNHKVTSAHTLNYGINSIFYYLDQGDFLPLHSESLLEPRNFEPEQGIETSIYLGDEWEVNSNLTLTGGLRYIYYAYLGPKTVYTFHDNMPTIEENITDTTSYDGMSKITDYNNLDYRFAAKYEINNNLSVKASYNKLHQYTFLLSNNISMTPTDKWKLVDNNIKPMDGSQYSLGFYKNFPMKNLEASVEGYYKSIDNLVEYKDGANLITNKIPQTEIIQGELEAYGVELMIKKKEGKLNGWINYTYSHTSVLVENETTGENVNFGNPYPANYDKPHAVNLAINYDITRRISISSNVVYSTGRPITYPTSIYYQNGMQITNFSQRNENRIPDYFRTDLSINFEGNLKKKKLAHGSWSISFYNLTGRKNPYSVYFRNKEGQIQGYKLSIFGTVIPSITYNLKLGNYDD